MQRTNERTFISTGDTCSHLGLIDNRKVRRFLCPYKTRKSDCYVIERNIGYGSAVEHARVLQCDPAAIIPAKRVGVYDIERPMTINIEYFPNGYGEEMFREKNTRLVNYGGFFTFFFFSIQTAAKDIVSNITRIHVCACV